MVSRIWSQKSHSEWGRVATLTAEDSGQAQTEALLKALCASYPTQPLQNTHTFWEEQSHTESIELKQEERSGCKNSSPELRVMPLKGWMSFKQLFGKSVLPWGHTQWGGSGNLGATVPPSSAEYLIMSILIGSGSSSEERTLGFDCMVSANLPLSGNPF